MTDPIVIPLDATDLERRESLEQMSPCEFAALFLYWLEKRGAVFALNPDNTFVCDLDPMPESCFDKITPEDVAYVVLGLKEEIKSILLSRQIVH